MPVACATIERHLLTAALAFAFCYFVLRALAFDHFGWIILVPFIGYLYVFHASGRFARTLRGSLDTVVLLYLINGVLITCASVVVGSARTATEIFLHYYFPAVLYFISRRYNALSIPNILTTIKIIWVLATILVVDIFLEYYLVEVIDNPTLVPWVKFEMEQVGYLSQEVYDQLKFNRVSSILTSTRTAGMVVAALFCFLLPFLHDRMGKETLIANGLRGWFPPRIVTAGIMLSLVACSFLLLNKTSTFSAVAVSAAYLAVLRSKNIVLFVATVLAAALLLFDQVVWRIVYDTLVQNYFYARIGDYQTVFSYILDFDGVALAYRDSDISTLVFGQFVASGPAVGFTELRALVYPLRFGMGWAVIVLAGMVSMMRYCYRLIRLAEKRFVSLLGWSFAGFFAIYMMDVHYPTFMRHGPIELFFVMAGALASLHEAACGAGKRTVGGPAIDVVPS